MKITLTGSLGNIGKPLAINLIKKGHTVKVISSNPGREAAIHAIGATAAIGNMFDPDFLSSSFKDADIVYLMETMEAAGNMFDKSVDFISRISMIGENYQQAIEHSGVKKVVHLSSIGAHTDKGNGFLVFHYNVEQLLRKLPDEVSIKFMRPVSFYNTLLSFIPSIKTTGAIISNYAGDNKEPWVSPLDIADVIAAEMDKPFEGRTVRYVASDEVSPNQIAKILGYEIGKPELEWKMIPSQHLLDTWLNIGFNEQIAKGFIEMQESQGNGSLYVDFYRNKPVLGKVKLADFAKQFAEAFNNL